LGSGKKIREAGQRAKSGRRVLLEARAEQRGEGIQGVRLRGGQPIFEIAPEACDRISLRRIRGKGQQGHILGQAESRGFGKGAVIQEQEMEALGIGGGKVVQEELKALGIEQRRLKKEALAGQRFHGPV